MSTIIQIKRSANVAAPNTTELVIGELAYSYDKANSGAGAKLYIEALDSGDAEVIHAIGGKYYTDAVDGATSASTANKIVKRDAFGSLAANNISVSGNVSLNGTKVSGSGTGFFVDPIVNNTSGNVVYYNPVTKELTYGSAGAASTANQLTTARNITLSGDLQGNVYFDGSQDVTIVANVISNSVALGTDTTGDYIANVIPGTGLTGSGFGTEGATPTLTLAASGVTANTYGSTTVVPVITIDTYGRVTNAANATIAHGVNIYGNSGVIAIATNGTGSLELVGGEGITSNASGTKVNFDLRTSGVTANTYGGASQIPVLNIDQYGRITAAANTSITVASETFKTISVSGQSDIVADTATDTLNISNTSGISLVTDAGTDTLTVGILNSGVTPATYGGTNRTLTSLTVDATGRITSAANISLGAIALGTDTSGDYVESLIAGTGIALQNNSGDGATPTITNTGVISLTGTANEVNVSSANGSITVSLPDDVIIGRDLSVTGNLYVTGNVVALPVENLVLEDSLIQLANNNILADIIDIGFYGSYNNDGGEHEHAGLFRDASDSGRFKLFQGLQGQDNLTATINVSGNGFSVATLVANLTGGTVSGLTANIVVGDGGTGRGTLTTNAILYGQGTSAVGLATGSAYQVLQLDSSGVPIFNGIDGGSY